LFSAPSPPASSASSPSPATRAIHVARQFQRLNQQALSEAATAVLGDNVHAVQVGLVAALAGLEEIQLIVAAHNREACALYERFGFVRVWTERHALKVGDHCVDAHHMVMTLGSTADDERTRESPALTANR
jgi:ribosomal protein S18 acetylase RimI-like enzyme